MVRPPNFPSDDAAEVASSRKAHGSSVSSKKARHSAEQSVTRLVLDWYIAELRLLVCAAGLMSDAGLASFYSRGFLAE